MARLLATGAFLGVCFWSLPSTVAEERELLKLYQGDVPVPDELYAVYEDLVRAFETGEQGNIEEYCLPYAIEFTTEERPEDTREYGTDINLPYLKDSFHQFIFTVHKNADDVFLLRTGTSALRFVKTATQGWKLYYYLDKPIQ